MRTESTTDFVQVGRAPHTQHHAGITGRDRVCAPGVAATAAAIPPAPVTYAVEMTDQSQLERAPAPGDLTVHQATGSWMILPAYAALSADAGFRRGWSNSDWRRHLAKPGIRWLSIQSGTRTAGLVELERDDDGEIQIALFGLDEQFRGRGMGAPSLALATRAAWALTDGRGVHPSAVWMRIRPESHPALVPTVVRCGFSRRSADAASILP